MKVQVSFTTKTILILLAMVLTVAIVISTVLIQESEARVLLEQRESQISNQRRVQLFEDILHGRMITLIDVISRKKGTYSNNLNELQQSLSDLSEYLTLNFQVESLLLFDEVGVVGTPNRPIDNTIERLVDTTRATFESRSLLVCDNVCTHYISIPVMADSDTIPIIVVSTSMRELLYLFSRATDVHKVAIVQAKKMPAGKTKLAVASQVAAANRQYLQSLFEVLPEQWRIDDLVIKGLNVVLDNQQLLVSLLPFDHASGDHPYLLIVQDVSAMVRQNEQYQYVVISSAIGLFLLFSSLLYVFLNHYRIRLLNVSERLPMLAVTVHQGPIDRQL
jgi:c-di-GMP phosphodiesterase